MLAFALLLAATDPTLHAVDRAFELLPERKKHMQARQLLVRATSTFDDQSLDGSDLEHAFAGDANKPWRGRPHERVLAHVVLAALEMERGRCDLALPSLKAAAFYDAKAAVDDVSDAVVVHALTLRCLIDEGADDGEVDAARARLDPRVAALALDPQARLVLDGRGPRYQRSGGHGEDVVVVGRGGIVVDPVVIALSRRAQPSKRLRGGVVVWDSLQQATTVQGRPYTKVLAERAKFKARHEQDAQRNLDASRSSLQNGDIVTAAAHVGFGAGLWSIASLADARADDRYVDHLPGTLRLIAPNAQQ